MKKAEYYSYTQITDPTNGISRKVVAHVRALQKLGYNTTLYGIAFDSIVGGSVTGRALGKGLFFLRAGIGILLRSRSELVIIRNPDSGLGLVFFGFFLFAAKLRSKKLVLDVPSYPYDGELIGFGRNIGLFVHRLHRPLFPYVFDFITYTGEKRCRIWGCKAKRLNNSSLVRFTGRHDIGVDRTTFVCIANLMYWHGFDRLIAGLCNYPGDDVVIWFFGTGEPEFSRLKGLAEGLGLGDRVKFWGKKEINEIAKLVPNGAIGVDSLGRHRSGNNYNDSIKSKDYIALGIPVVKSHKDDSIDSQCFVYTVDSNESPLDIVSILNWRRGLLELDSSAFEEFTRCNSYLNQFKKIL